MHFLNNNYRTIQSGACLQAGTTVANAVNKSIVSEVGNWYKNKALKSIIQNVNLIRFI